MIYLSTISYQVMDLINNMLFFLLIFIIIPQTRSKLNVILAILASITFSFIDLYHDSTGLLLPIVSYFFLFRTYKPRVVNRILTLITSTLINAFSQSLAGLIALKLFNYDGHMLEMLISNVIGNYIIALLIVYSGIFAVHWLSRYIDFNDKIIVIIITSALAILLMGLIALTIVSRILNVQLEYMQTNIILSAIIFIFIFLGTLYYIAGYLKQQRAIKELDKLKENRLYIKELEDSYNEMRKFKHDYKNLLLSLSIQLQDNQNTAASETINKLLKDSSIEQASKLNYPGLFSLKDELIRGIIISKLITVKNENIATAVEIAPDINISRNDSITITRILGILFDNAIEACRNESHPFLDFALISDPKYTEFIITNNTAPNAKINLNQIFSNGFSTKENHSGLGLTNVQELVNKKPNFFLKTKFENDEFTVILTIEKEN